MQGVMGTLSSLGSGAGVFSTLGLAATAMGAAAVVGFGAAVKSAIDYQTQMTNIGNNADLTSGQVKQMSSQILKLGADTGQSTTLLSEGFMHAYDMSHNYATGMAETTVANEAAIASGDNVANTTNILANAMHEYGYDTLPKGISQTQAFAYEQQQAAHVMGVMHLAAADSNMTLQQFSDSAGPAIAMAANFHVPLEQASAALAAMSQHGLDASMSATNLRAIIQHISAPTKAAETSIKALSKASGVDLVKDFSASGLASKGLTGILADLHTAFDKTGMSTAQQAGELEKLIPATRGGLGMMILMGTGAQDYSRILGDLNNQQLVNTITQKQYDRVMQTAGQQIKVLKDQVEAFAITVGTVVLPVISHLLSGFEDAFSWIGKHKDDVLAALAGIAALLTAVMAPAIGAAIAAFGALVVAIAPIVAVGAAAAGAALLIYKAWTTNFLGIRTIVMGAIDDIKQAFDEARQFIDLALGDINRIGHVASGTMMGWPGLIRPFIPILAEMVNLFGLGRDAVKTFKEALSGNWVDSSKIESIAHVAGEIGLAFHAAGLALHDFATIGHVSAGSILAFPKAIQPAVQWLSNLAVTVETLGRDAERWFLGTAVPAIEKLGHAVMQVLGPAIRLFETFASTVLDVGRALLSGGFGAAAARLRADVPKIGEAIHKLLDAIGHFDLSELHLAERVGTWLEGEIKKIPWSTIGADLKRGLSTALGFLDQGLKLAGHLGADILHWLEGEIKKIPWSTVEGDLKRGLDLAWTGLKFVAAKAGDLGSDVLRWLEGEIKQIDWGALAHDLARGLDVALAGLKFVASKAGHLGADIFHWVEAQVTAIDWSHIGHDIEAGIGKALDSIKGGAIAGGKSGGLLGAILGPLDQIAGPLAKLGKSIIDALKPVVESIKSSLAPTLRQLVKLWDALKPAIHALLPVLEIVGAIIGGALVLALEIALTVFSALVGLFTGALPGAIQLVTGIVEVFTGIWDVLEGVVVGVITIIVDLLQGKWGAAWNAAKAMVQQVWNGIKLIVKGTADEMIGFVRAFLEGIKGFFQNGFDTVLGIFQGFGINVKQHWQDTWNSVKSTAENIWHDITSEASSIWNGIKATIEGVWNDIKQQASDIWNGIKSTIQNAWNDIKTAVNDAITTIKGWASTFWSDEKQGWQNLWNDVESIISGAWDTVKGYFQDAWNTIKGWAQTFWTDEKTGWTNLFNDAKSIISGAWSTIKGYFTSAFSTIKGWASTFWTDEKQGWVDLWNDVKALVSGAWTTIKTDFSQGISDIKQLWNAGWKALSQAVTDAKADVLATVQGLISSVKGLFGDALSWLYDAGKDVVDGLANGIKAAVGDAISAANSVGNAVKGAIKSFGLSPWPSMIESGHDVVDGLVVGMTDSIPGLIASAATVSDGLIGGFNAALEISSPSRKGHKVGKSVTDGVTAGIKDGTATAAKAAGDAGKAVADALSSTLQLVQSAGAFQASGGSVAGVSGMLSSLTTVATQLTDGFADFALKMKTTVMTQVQSAATAVSGVVKAFEDVITFLQQLQSFVDQRTLIMIPDHLQTVFGTVIVLLLQVFQYVTDHFTGAILTAIQSAATAVDAVFKPFEDVMTFLQQLTTFTDGQNLIMIPNHLQTVFGTVMDLLLSVFVYIASEFSSDILASIQTAATAVDAVIKPFEDILTFLTDLSTFTDANTPVSMPAHIQTKLGTVMVQLTDVFRYIVNYFHTDVLSSIKDAADAVDAVLKPFEDVLTFLTDLNTFVEAKTPVSMPAHIQTVLGTVMVQLTDVFRYIRNYFGSTVLASIKDAADAVDAVFKPFEDVLTFLKDLDTFCQANTPTQMPADIQTTLGAVMIQLTTAFLTVANGFKTSVYTSIKTAADAIDSVFKPFEDALTFLTDLTTFLNGSNVQSVPASLLSAMSTVLLQLVAAFQQIQAQVSSTVLKSISDAATAIDTVFKPFEDALTFLKDETDFLKANAGSTVNDDLVPFLASVAGDIVYAFENLAQQINGPALAAADKTATGVAAIVTVMANLVTMFGNIAKMSEVSKAQWGIFVQNFSDAMGIIPQLLDSAQPALAAAQSFLSVAQQIAQALQAGMDTLKPFGISVAIQNVAANTGSAAQAAAQTAQSVTDQVNSQLGINSPSTVMAASGQQVDAGLAQGITTGTPAVQQAAGTLANQLVAAFTQSVNAAGGTNPIMSSGNTTATTGPADGMRGERGRELAYLQAIFQRFRDQQDQGQPDAGAGGGGLNLHFHGPITVHARDEAHAKVAFETVASGVRAALAAKGIRTP